MRIGILSGTLWKLQHMVATHLIFIGQRVMNEWMDDWWINELKKNKQTNGSIHEQNP